MQITGGKVSFSRSVQPAQYETKRADVELSFVLAEGETLADALDQVAALAKGKGLEMVGLKENGAGTGTKQIVTPPPAATTSVPTTGNGRTKADLEKEALAAAAAKPTATKPPATKKTEPKADAASIVEEPAANISTSPEDRKDPAVIEDADPLGLGVEAAKPLTDAELISEIQGHNSKVSNPTEIKKLVAIFAGGGAPKTARDIPADKRAEFVTKLKQIKPLA